MKKPAIVNALRQKGFSKRSATNIAKSIIKKSKQTEPNGYMTNWKNSISAEMKLAAGARANAERLHGEAAVNKCTMAGKIVVVTKK